MKLIKKCSICGEPVKVDQWGNGKCKNCGWNQNLDCETFPDAINPPNFVSLNKAKKLYNNEKPFLPTYDEMLKLVERGLDLSFVYNKVRYQLDLHNSFTIWKVSTKEFKEYKDFKDFSENLTIENVLLKDVWHKIKSLRYEC